MKILAALVSFFFCTTLSAQFSWTEITVPVRDGNRLAADLYSTDTTDARPVILIQTPYNKNLYRLTAQLPPQAGSGFPKDTGAFHYVIVDWRGFWGSRDVPAFGYDRGLDGYDAVEWIAEQSWCNGKVGTWGPSALGVIQFQTARHQPPHLVCAVPLVKDFKTKYGDYYYGGEYRKAHVEALQTLGFFATSLVLSHPTNDFFIKTIESNSDYPEEFAVPMLMIGGWFDHYPDDVLRAFGDIQERSHADVRDQHRFIFGPWTHSGIDKSGQGELEYPDVEGVANRAALQFFAYYLLGEDNGWPQTPPVRYYQLGENEWREADSWSDVVDAADSTFYYLRGEGVLSRTGIGGPDVMPNELRYDPFDPSPTHGGSFFSPLDKDAAVGPYDQREVVESRADALLYTTAPFESDLEVNGPVAVELYVSSDRPDTDFAARLCDVYPDGRSMLLTQGIRRLRFRDGFEPQDTALGVPGEVYRVVVELQNLAVTFKAGHRLRIIVTGSNHPHFEVNPNTAAPLYNSPDSVVATSRIFLAPQYPSRVVLPTARTSGVLESAADGRVVAVDVAPNPVQGRASLTLAVDRPGRIQVMLCDAAGRSVLALRERAVEAGEVSIPIEMGENLAAGTYFCRVFLDGVLIAENPVVLVR